MNSEKENELSQNVNIFSRLEKIEKRLERVEKALFLIPIEEELAELDRRKKEKAHQKETDVEGSIGEHGLAWLGSIVMIFGIIYLTQYLNSIGYKIFSSVFGSLTAIGVYLLAKYIKNNNQNLSQLFSYVSYLLIYYFILQLHFFNANPIIQKKIFVVIALIIINIYLYFSYFKTEKSLLLVMAHFMLIITAMVANYSPLYFVSLTILSILAIYIFKKHHKFKLLFFSQVITYIAALFWVLGNPVAGNAIKFQTTHQYTLAFIIIIAGIYSTILFFDKKETENYSEGILTAVILNGIFFTLALINFVIALFESHYIWIFLSLFAICLGFSVRLKIKTKWKNTPSLYALYSFMAFSVAVFSYFNLSWALFFLALESLLVVSIALWYRAKIFIVLNLILFIILIIISLFSKIITPQVYFIFPAISLVSARIINWQKNRLDIKTEFIRNTYLAILFFFSLFALYKNVPDNFTTISWTITAVLFFIISIVLKNTKYRYLAIATLIASTLYLLLIDLSRIDLIYRVLAFLILATILLVVSIYYSRIRKRSKNNS